MSRLPHYFTAFQAFVMKQAEEDRSSFDLRMALLILEREAEYRATQPSPQGLFIYQFECIGRNKLGYDRGFQAMSEDPLFDSDWRNWILKCGLILGSVDFADLIYLRSEQGLIDQRPTAAEACLPTRSRRREGFSGIFWSAFCVMQKSEFFDALSSMYEAEMDDLLSDSDGKNVLAQRLQTKREQLSDLLPMMDFAPEMVAPVFHEAFSFSAPARMDAVVLCEPDDGDLPAWAALESRITVADWAQPMVDRVLAEPGGDTFLVVAAALEFLRLHEAGSGGAAAAPATDAAPRARRGDDDSDDDGDDQDLAESGNNWMSEQGFDALDA